MATTIRPRATVRCTRCKDPIEWIKMKSGKNMPVQEGPYITIVTDNGETYRGRESHWGHCPFAKEFRKDK